MSLYQKSLLATALLILAVAQLAFIATYRGWVGKTSRKIKRRALILHRYGGYLALVLVMLIAISCLFVIRYIGNPYKSIHIVLGILTVALAISKVVVAKVLRRHRQVLLSLGICLLAVIGGAWLTSAVWYLVNFEWG